MSHDAKLVHMANQIGKFFAAQGEAKAVAGVATHLRRFWDPRMRRAIIAQVESGHALGLDPWPLAAVRKLAAEAGAPATVPKDAERAKLPAGLTPSETGMDATEV
jgi:formate dehydrogenase subunit delta